MLDFLLIALAIIAGWFLFWHVVLPILILIVSGIAATIAVVGRRRRSK